MRIIHTDTDDIDNPLGGGQPVRTFEVNRRLANRHDISVLTSSYKQCQRELTREGVHYQRLGLTVPRWGLSSHLTYLARLPAALKQMPHDLVVEEFVPPFGFCDLQRYTSQPVVSIVQWFFFDDWEKRYKLPFESLMRKRALAQPNRHIIVQTHAMGEYFKSLIPKANIVKIPCGIDPAILLSAQTEGDYALFLGRLDIHHKGLDDLLLAWKLLVEQGIHIPLRIVGDGRDGERLKELTKVLGLQHCVQFLGRLSGLEKYQVIRQSRMMVMPSRQETFGITALEAMASGRPVVAYDIPHMNEVLRPNWSQLLKLGDVDGFSRAVAEYWKNSAYARAHGQAGYEAAAAYSWNEIALQQDAFYREVIKTGS